ncbi:DUF4142 domain-containing protein [Caenimonas soli]|uniref:DUF4142 domain-containing protein n=1 Tax=Caenimonas soli TaxID=2735555 RepID=UPI001556F498|nr:DUF4142 domain-containing protein [Caenimonas soli]NPC55483.1 DUF4142 domain-containing protein [Caenimonas soli]
MKCVSVSVVAAASAMLWTAAATAVTETKTAPPRPAFFAAAAAVNIKPMTLEHREERRFLKDAAAASRFQGDAARMALSKSNDAGVRSFAAAQVNHQAAATTTLQHMLHVRGMAPPMLDNDQRKTLNRLGKLNGRKFDREFMEEVALKSQQQEVEHYEKASQTVRDPALKAWIDQTLPTLRYHLATAERSTPAEVKSAKPVAPAKAVAAQPVRQVAAQPVNKATQSMGAGPAKLGMQQPGGTMQLGVTKAVAARPIASNSR